MVSSFADFLSYHALPFQEIKELALLSSCWLGDRKRWPGVIKPEGEVGWE